MSLISELLGRKKEIPVETVISKPADVVVEPEVIENAHVPYKFTDEDRNMSSLTRTITAQTKELEKTFALKNKIAQLNMLQAELDTKSQPAEQETSLEAMAIQTILGAFMNRGQPQAQPQQQEVPKTQPNNLEVTMTDEEILEIIKTNVTPQQREMAKKMQPETLAKIIKSRFPNLSVESIARAIELL